jgi:DNA topoisomerase-1
MEKNTHTTLFIVESPIKVKTIEKFLGSEYIIRASVGHIADIPERTGTVDVSNAFAATYELTAKGQEIITQLKKDMKQCREIINSIVDPNSADYEKRIARHARVEVEIAKWEST